MKMLIAALASLLLAACSELPQDGVKPFAGEGDAKSYADAKFKGDKRLFEKTLAERADTQNEYLRMPD